MSVETIIGILSMVFIVVVCLIFVYKMFKVSNEVIWDERKTLCDDPNCPLNKKEKEENGSV